MKDYEIRVLVTEYEDCLVAQCVEFDVAAQARNIADLFYELQATLVGHLLVAHGTGKSLNDLPPAPPEVWQEWMRARVFEGEPERLPWAPPELLSQLPRPHVRFASA